MATRHAWTVLVMMAAGASVAVTEGTAGELHQIDFSTRTGQQVLGTPLVAGDSVLVRGAARDPGAFSNTFGFRSDTVRSIAVTLSWNVGQEFRMVGVNLDLDGPGGFVASDTFQGLLADVAVSSLEATGLALNKNYRLILTGTAIAATTYTLTIDTAR